MRPGIENFLKSAPTFFDIYEMYRKEGNETRTFVLPFSLEDLVMECAEKNLAVSGFVGATRKDLLFVHEGDDNLFREKCAQIINDGGGLKIAGTQVAELYKFLNGEPIEVQPSDFDQVYERAGDQIKGLLVVSLAPGRGFGEFIEEYVDHEYHPLIYDAQLQQEFASDFDDVCLDPTLYRYLDRFLKRHELVKKHQMISPRALFNQQTGNLMVEFTGQDSYFPTFIELKKDEGASNVIGFMRVDKKGVVG